MLIFRLLAFDKTQKKTFFYLPLVTKNNELIIKLFVMV